ncbi:MAG: HAMP domain-containing histidine kinase [Polyangiaceae bacterium]|nr:HAMP domain-containing histidine kinase [Polyangiaceae bacterium]
MTDSATSLRPSIARQLALGYFGVSVVSVVMCASLLFVIFDVGGLVSIMRGTEDSIQRGLELSAAVRELNIHIGHSLIEGDESHLDHYRKWRGVVHHQIDKLEQELPASERPKLEQLRKQEQRMHHVFLTQALPAAEANDTKAYRRAHREIEKLGEALAEGADALATDSNSRMARSHVSAKSATNLGLASGGACVLIVVLLSVISTMRLRRQVLSPLVKLTAAAEQVGRGEFDIEVGNVGSGELQALARALDDMARELAFREARLLKQERMAVLGQLAAGVAHELNNPIGIIRGYLKTMLSEVVEGELREELVILDEEAEQCQRIAEDLLSYSRTPVLAKTFTPIAEFVHLVRDRFTERGSCAPTIEVDVEPADVPIDPGRLRQVLFNLLENALESNPEGELVSVRGRKLSREYVIEVEDDGDGVNEQDRARIFEPFFSKRSGGTGLGLAVCAGIVGAHGGKIEVESGEMGGALFRITLPLAAEGGSR